MPETTLQCIRYLRHVLPDSNVSVEVEKPGREGLVELAAASDVVFYSKAWAEVSHIIPVPLQHLLDTSVGIARRVTCYSSLAQTLPEVVPWFSSMVLKYGLVPVVV